MLQRKLIVHCRNKFLHRIPIVFGRGVTNIIEPCAQAYLDQAILGSFIALGNIGGCIGAYLRRRRGEGGGFSCVHFLSMLFCGLAWLLSRDQFSPWVFLPMILDPANWLLAYLPLFLLLRSRDHSRFVE